MGEEVSMEKFPWVRRHTEVLTTRFSMRESVGVNEPIGVYMVVMKT